MNLMILDVLNNLKKIVIFNFTIRFLIFQIQ
jgi:hypothetical protein